MLLVRFGLLMLAVVAAIVVAVVADVWWLGLLAVLLLIALTVAAVLLTLHYTGAPDWLGPEDEATLERSGLVEAETGLPKRRRWNERRAQDYADEVARRGLVAVPDGWRGPEGSHRVLLVTTVAVGLDRLRAALAGQAEKRGLAVLVVVPTLASTEGHFRTGNATEAVEHAEQVARDTVAALSSAGISVAGHIGAADPAVALSDGLRTYDAERVVVVRHHTGAGRYLEDVPLARAADAFGVPLTELAADGDEHAADRR